MYKVFLRQRQRQWHYRTRWQLAAHPRPFAAEEQQQFEEKAVKNQDEDEVESHVDEAKKLQTTRSTESEVQRATNEKSRVAEVTKTETSKIYHEVVNVTRSHSRKFSREVLLRTSHDNQ